MHTNMFGKSARAAMPTGPPLTACIKADLIGLRRIDAFKADARWPRHNSVIIGDANRPYEFMGVRVCDKRK